MSHGLRSALAINLALTAAQNGFGVALIDAASRNAKLTRAVREATGSQPIIRGVFFATINNVLLALPKGHDESLGRIRVPEMLDYLRDAADQNIDLVICDGPDAAETGADFILGKADDIVLIDAQAASPTGAARGAALDAAAAKLRATVHFDEVAQPRRKAG